MSHKKKPNEQAPKGRQPDQALEAPEAPEAPAKADAAQVAVTEPLDQQIQRLERELAEWKDRALRTAADLDNYRKRAIREREEALGRGQGEVLQRMVEVVDDLARVAHLDPAQTSSDALHEGMLAIERKFLKTLETVGVARLEAEGKPFDPHQHEAVATLPASSADQDQLVGAVYQHGYTFRGVLLRAARVAVLTWTAPSGGDGDLMAEPDAGDVGGEAGD